MPWIVNVLFSHEDEIQVLEQLSPIVEKHQGVIDVSGTEHQSWSFETRDAAYAFAEEAADVEKATVIEPEEEMARRNLPW